MRPLIPVLALLAACANEDYARLYTTAEHAPSLTWASLEALDHMGPTIVDGGVNFSVYSARAERVEVLLFDDPESDVPTQQFQLVNSGDVWNIFVEGIGLGQHYGYIAWGPNWPHDDAWYPGSTIGFQTDVDRNGNRFNPNKLLFDPWGTALHRDHDWSKGSTASGPSRYELTYAAAAKTVVTKYDFAESMAAEDIAAITDVYTWSDQEADWRAARQDNTLDGHDWTDLILYEVQPKGLTANPASGVAHPGTWRGIGEMAPYLQDLGITAVELMPVHEKPLDGGYWGYNNMSFFSPELTFSAEYAATGRVDGILDEFKEMVDQLHQHDIEVIVDVVYNHTGEGGLWRERLYFADYDAAYEVNFDPKEVAGLYSYRGLDNYNWYALSDQGQSYWNNTGVGNQVRVNNDVGARLVMDSLHFMVEELHVDGFRFDLAGILGEQDLDYNSPVDASQTILQDIIDDPILQQHNVRIIAEPWTASGTGPGIGGFPMSEDGQYGWFEWNAHYRDWWRSFVNDDDFGLNSTEGVDGGAVMTGSSSVYAWNGRKPWHSVNFVTVHDGFTMYDLFSYEEKQNGCGLLNTICCDDPLSVWCDDESGEDHNRSRDWGDEPFKRQQMRNMFTALLVNHGTPMLYGGDEWMRTQYGNNNAYSTWADNEWNWFRWGEWESTYAWHRHRMHDFVRKLIQLRKDHSYAFAPAEHGGGMPFSWKNTSNSDMADDDWSGRTVMIHYYDDGSWDEPELLVIVNGAREDVAFDLPGGRTWERLVDTQEWFDTPGNLDESGGWFSENPSADPYVSYNIWPASDDAEDVTDSYTAVGSTIVVLREVP